MDRIYPRAPLPGARLVPPSAWRDILRNTYPEYRPTPSNSTTVFVGDDHWFGRNYITVVSAREILVSRPEVAIKVGDALFDHKGKSLCQIRKRTPVGLKAVRLHPAPGKEGAHQKLVSQLNERWRDAERAVAEYVHFPAQHPTSQPLPVLSGMRADIERAHDGLGR